MKIVEIVETLIQMQNKRNLTQMEDEAVRDACNILDKLPRKMDERTAQETIQQLTDGHEEIKAALQEAINTLDGVIPPPQSKMVDLDHLPIAAAWQRIKTALLESELTQEKLENLTKWRDNQIEAIRRRIDAGTLTGDDRRLLDELCLPHEYDRRVNR